MMYFWIALGICLGFAAIWLFVFANNSWLKTTYYDIQTDKIDGGKVIVHLSDLHGKSFGRGNARLINRIKKISPDFIAVTGDIIHNYSEKNKRVALCTASALCAVAPVIYVSGNHEMRNKGYRFFRRDLMEAGVTVLDDCTADICGLTVVGLNCASQKNGKIFKLCDGLKGGKFKLLLAHKPQFLEEYSKSGVDLILSGHAHGGQWRIPFTSVGFYSPGQGLLPRMTSGVHACGNTNEVISRGLGNSQCPLRLFNRPEVVVVRIKNCGKK